ncbi:MAG: alpha/beta hydrolase, partial [Saprospiraceae bacterium]
MVNGNAIAPVEKYDLTPDDLNIPFQTIALQTPDECTLQAWYMPALTSLGRNVTIVIANSDAGNMGDVLPYAIELYRKGYDVLTFDYRGFGASDSYDYHPDALYLDEYRTDFQTAIRWLKKRQPEREICVLSFSMGTWVAATSHSITPFDYFVGEAVIYRPDLIIERIQESNDTSVLL